MAGRPSVDPEPLELCLMKKAQHPRKAQLYLIFLFA